MRTTRFIKKTGIIKVVYDSAILYPAPSNLNYWWNFGSLALVFLVFQVLTGIFLAMHYVAQTQESFAQVEHIMRDVNYGWLLRYMHLNGASFFFLMVYTHLFRGLYYGSFLFPRDLLWNVGVIILFIMILTAFMGYVLPWGQMSFWAATVITNLASVVPGLGGDIVLWLWGAFSVDNATLNRFFSLHYVVPFVLIALVGVHLILLHECKSSNPLGTSSYVDTIALSYYVVKDVYAFSFVVLFSGWFAFFYPNLLGHPDNYIPANPMVTPTHIVPEWYFLPFYAILRSVPNKSMGVVLLVAAIIVLFLLPILTAPCIKGFVFRPPLKILFWAFLGNCIALGWLGGSPIEEPFYALGQFCALFYFGFFIIVILFSHFEDYLVTSLTRFLPRRVYLNLDYHKLFPRLPRTKAREIQEANRIFDVKIGEVLAELREIEEDRLAADPAYLPYQDIEAHIKDPRRSYARMQPIDVSDDPIFKKGGRFSWFDK